MKGPGRGQGFTYPAPPHSHPHPQQSGQAQVLTPVQFLLSLEVETDRSVGRAGQQLPEALGFVLKEHVGSWQTWPSWAHMSLSWGWLAPLEKCGSWKATFSSERLPGPGRVGGEWDAELRLTRSGPVTSPGGWGPKLIWRLVCSHRFF